MEPEKLDLKSHQISDDKKTELVKLFPEVQTEDGKIDFEKLKLTLGETVDVGKERYGMNWPGKAECFKTIQQPSMATLMPAKKESVKFDETKNLFIEGDNLEVLKLLQKSYMCKVKMIYIDPPYNTGNDFIYPDNYSESLDTYLEYTSQVDADGRKFSTNTEADGRFHSKWINMIYPRLFLARNLLKDDGVIFLNIGSEELFDLIAVCNEIFGEENKVSIISRVAKTASNLGTHFADSVDYILCYAKNILKLEPFSAEVDKTLYLKVEQEGPRKGEKFRDDVAFYQSSQTGIRPNQKYFIECPDGSKVLPPCSRQDEIMREGDGRWRWSKERYLRDKEFLVFKKTKTSPLLDEKGNKADWNIYTKSYLKDREETGTLPRNIFTDFINRKGADLLKRYDIEFDFSKPMELIKYLMDIVGCESDDIVCDFFAGSATTAHSVLEKNYKDGKNIQFLLIQLPELCAENSDLIKSGFKTIADIGKERIRRVINKMNEEDTGQLSFNNQGTKRDRGFKVFKLQISNFKSWNNENLGDAEKLGKQLEMHVDHILKDRTKDDILYEILLKSGYPLTTKIETLSLEGKTVYSIHNGSFLICLEKPLTLEVIRAMADKKPERVVCLDEGFVANDQLKTNAVQTFKSKGVTSFRTV